MEVEDLCWREEGFGIRLIFCSSSTEDIMQNRSGGRRGWGEGGGGERKEKKGRGNNWGEPERAPH